MPNQITARWAGSSGVWTRLRRSLLPPVLSGSHPQSDTPLQHVCLDRPLRRFFGAVPPSALSVPSMISDNEKRMLYGLARSYYRGDGIIVDAGIFLGASTRCFAEGLRANRRLDVAQKLKARPIVSFERGTVNPTMPAFFERKGLAFDIPVGGDFLPLARANIAPVEDLVDLRAGDILLDEEPLDDPIELCFLDILKGADISARCLQRFFARLIPGRSIVIQQDYFYDRLPFIKTHQEYLRDHFDFVGEIGSTALFRFLTPIPAEKLAALSAIDKDEQFRLADIATRRSRDPNRRFLTAISKVRLVAILKGKTEGLRQLEIVKADYPEQIAGEHPRIMESLHDIEAFCLTRPDPRPRRVKEGTATEPTR